jgi:hypothetical protein
MSLSKSKCWYSNNWLRFLKRAVPLKKYRNNRDYSLDIERDKIPAWLYNTISLWDYYNTYNDFTYNGNTHNT